MGKTVEFVVEEPVLHLKKDVKLADLPFLDEAVIEKIGECVEDVVEDMLRHVGLTFDALDTYKWEGKITVTVRTTVPWPKSDLKEVEK